MAAVAMCFVQYEAILAMKMTKLNVHSVISLSKCNPFLPSMSYDQQNNIGSVVSRILGVMNWLRIKTIQYIYTGS